MHRLLIVIEKADGNYSAYSPDLPGCIATGASREEAEKNMYRAVEMHIKRLREDGLPVPVTNEDIQAAISYAADLAEERHIPLEQEAT